MQAQRFIQVRWTLPAGLGARAFEIASAPDTDGAGAFLPPVLVHRETLRDAETGVGPGYQLDGGVYFVHVGGTTAGCGSCAIAWSNPVQLRVPQGTRPAIAFAQFALSDHDTEGRKTPAIWISVEACDDTKGNLRVVIEELHIRRGQVDRRRLLIRNLYLAGVPCPGRQLISWPILRGLRTLGELTVHVHIVDLGGRSSRVVSHSWRTTLIPSG